MTTLYTYIVRVDGGSAPNPFWGCCTLAICKPKIRLSALVGDLVAGFGATRTPQGNLSGRLVYAMEVTSKLSMAEYDTYSREHLPEKIPEWRSKDWRRRLGDSIYDFATDPPTIRKGVHGENQRRRDLSGRFVLLSTHFYYFGREAVPLPPDLHQVIPVTQGHRSRKNRPWVEPFVRWLEGLGLTPNELQGEPQTTRLRRVQEPES